MKRIVCASILTLSAVPAWLLFTAAAQAEVYTYCYPVEEFYTIADPGNHPNAYDDGYREGADVARRGQAYKLRSVGGEFARGFDDGYYGRPFTGQRNTIPNRRESRSTTKCNNYTYDKNESVQSILDRVVRDVEKRLRENCNNNTSR